MPIVHPTTSLKGESIYDILNREFQCEHDGQQIRRKVCANGTEQFRYQCLTCGRLGQPLKKASLFNAPYPDVDETLGDSWWEKRQQRYQELEGIRRREWFAGYDNYLDSREWATRRMLVMQRANGICEGCRVRQATEVHHLTYDRVGREMLFDLVAICRECHRQITKVRE